MHFIGAMRYSEFIHHLGVIMRNLNRATRVLVISLIGAFFSLNVFAAERFYELKVENITANFTGEDVPHALAINGTIPAPTLKFKLGDTAVIKVINTTNEPTTLHWHGLLVPWDQDGPQFANTRIIEPGKTHTFRFPLKHTGTYWYHSHTELQEQRGLYGAIVIEDDHDRNKADHDLVVVMSDWTNEHPQKVLSNLKMDGDYYAFKKKFYPSILGAIRAGAFWDYVKSEWTKMGPMDLSDVGYDAFLINGKQNKHLKNIKAGEKVRLRLINASASTYFYANLGDLFNFKVITKDGVEVQPVEVNEILVGIAETYDITFTMPEHKALEFKATAQDITGASSLILGTGHHVEKVPMKMRPNPFGMGGMDHGSGGSTGGDHGGGHGDGNHDAHNMDMGMPKEEVEKMPMTKRLKYSMLKSPKMTMFDPKLPRREYNLELNGDMDRYVWTINGKSFSEEKYLMVKYGEVVRIKFMNKTMMHHPMHLHGHFFRVLNGQGHFAPNFHTVDVAPMGMVTIEFHANEPGIWFLHCHNLYHMKMGMARFVKYEGFERTEGLIKDEKKWSKYMTHDNSSFTSAELGVHSNASEVEVKVSKGRYQVDINLEMDKYDPDTFEGELLFRRYVDRFLNYYAGAEYDEGLHGVLGIAYTAPFRVEVQTHVRTDGKVVVNLRKIFPVASRLNLDLSGRGTFGFNDKTEWETETGLYYQVSPRVDAGINYRYDTNIGHTVGAGVRININKRKKKKRVK